MLNSSPCSGSNWLANTGWTDKYGETRYWFDCGKFYFDGTYNVVELPVGMSLYHGSAGLVWSNNQMPLGLEYYQPGSVKFTSQQKSLLKDPSVPLAQKEQLLDRDVSPGWYGDLQVAREYSQKGEVEEFTCNDKCVLAYVTTKPLVMMDLNDPFNLRLLLQSPDIPVEIRDALAQAHVLGNVKVQPGEAVSLALSRIVDTRQAIENKGNNDPSSNLQQAYHPLKRYLGKTNRVTSRQQGYLLPLFLIKKLVQEGYTGYVNPRTPYIKEGKATGLSRFPELVFGSTVQQFLRRDYTNPYDWQHQSWELAPPTVRRLLEDFSTYRTLNISGHSGDLIEHSLWTMFFADKMFTTRWRGDLDAGMLTRRLVSVAAFLHYLGKGGRKRHVYYDKPDHPQVGGQMILGKTPYRVKSKDIPIKKVLEELGITDEVYIRIIAAVAASHWEFGVAIRDSNPAEYYNKVLKVLQEYQLPMILSDKKELRLFLQLLILISAADIQAQQPYIDHQSLLSGQGNKRSDIFPYLSNRSKVYPGGILYSEDKAWNTRQQVLSLI